MGRQTITGAEQLTTEDPHPDRIPPVDEVSHEHGRLADRPDPLASREHAHRHARRHRHALRRRAHRNGRSERAAVGTEAVTDAADRLTVPGGAQR